jgi:predicted ferric reductase
MPAAKVQTGNGGMAAELPREVNSGSGRAWPSRGMRLGSRAYLLIYLSVLVIPYAAALTIGVQHRALFQTVVTVLNICGLAALLLQFPLASRSRALARTMGIDQAMVIHRKVGELLAIFFFLHPFLIVAPRLLIAPQRALGDIWTTFTAANVQTGLYAWMILIVWVLVAWSRRKAGLSYEAWRLSHGLGFVAVAILATLHAITVGRHGQAQPWFNWIWISGCSMAVVLVAYGLVIRPGLWRRRPFRVVQVTKASASDWELELEKSGDFPFEFDAGQFVWLTTSRLPWLRVEHPFSIASSPAASPRLKFIIRQLGDFTATLGGLQPGRQVLVDGPFGIFTLAGRRGHGVALIAGGAGIGPILGIIRGLRDQHEARPIRLLYGNRTADQLVCQDELRQIERDLPDFRQIIALERPDPKAQHTGFIDRNMIAAALPPAAKKHWLIFVCGSPAMVHAVVRALRRMGYPEHSIIYEQLGF